MTTCSDPTCAIDAGGPCRACAVMPVQCNHCREYQPSRGNPDRFAISELMGLNPVMGRGCRGWPRLKLEPRPATVEMQPILRSGQGYVT